MEKVMTAIRMSNACKEYKNSVVALHEVNCSLEYGKMYAVIGNSGAGKTTFLQTAATFTPLSKGEVYINGEAVSALKKNDIARIRREIIGYVFQNYLLNVKLNAEENVLLPMLSKRADYEVSLTKSRSLLALVGLREKGKCFPQYMSGGEKQRIAIARALANDPKILLADEPTGNLDEQNQKQVIKLFRDLANRGKCVVVVTHSKDVQERADYVLKMEAGRLFGKEEQ